MILIKTMVDKEQIVNKENAILLKEIGYREPTYLCYSKEDDNAIPYCSGNLMCNNQDQYISAPLLSNVIDWLRSEKDIFLLVNRYSEYFCTKWPKGHKTWKGWGLKLKEAPYPREWDDSFSVFTQSDSYYNTLQKTLNKILLKIKL